MTEDRVQRRLAAILAADVAGYSKLMGADEAGTLAVLRDIWADHFNPVVTRHGGRVVKMMGDGALVEFASAVDSVECAVAIQNAMAAFNAGRDGPKVEFRIGVNLGDIVIEGDDIFGEGVNVAARLESQAPTNGVLVSEGIYAQVRGKVAVEFSDAGELALKNIAAAVRAWVWGGEGMPVAPAPAAPRDEGPSIAVLPFTNMSGDPEQEYFSDGISEDIITDLSKVAGLMVVARNSSFVYKGRTVDIRTVGRELGVSSVLEGSIRRAGSRVRITAQLIDARTGAHLWGERYDRDLTDIFAVQDEVTLQIVGALRVTLRPVERARFADGRTTNVEAHDSFLLGRELLMDTAIHSETFARSVAAFLRAIELDPDYPDPHAGLAMAYCQDFQNHYSGVPDPLGLAEHFSRLAIEKGPHDAYAHFVRGVVAVWQRNLTAARAMQEQALALSPNYALALGALGQTEVYLGDTDSAIGHLHRAIQLDPGFTHQYVHFLGTAHLVSGHDEEAVAAFRERVRLFPRTDLSRAFLASALGHLGEIEAARQVWSELCEINPKYDFAEHLARSPFQNPANAARIAEGLAKAGLPV